MKTAICAFLLLIVSPIAALHAEDINPGGFNLVQIVDGPEWRTSITLVNLDSVTAYWNMSFSGDDGTGKPFATTLGTAKSIQGTLAVGASTIIDTLGTMPAGTQGWARLYTYQTVGGSFLLRRVVPGSSVPVIEATFPIELNISNRYAIPFDHTTSSTGLALLNPFFQESVTINFTFRDQDGTAFDSGTVTLQPFHHVAHIVTDLFPSTAGRAGTIELIGTGGRSDGNFSALALRATSSGSLAATIPLVNAEWRGQ